ncbi:MAG: hypothetical protein PHW22_00015 [Bacilli bacterium]|nr:hypothetical protein [Bacilli bacterium]
MLLLVNSILEQWMKDNVLTIVFIVIFAVLILGSIVAMIVNKIVEKNKKGEKDKSPKSIQ